MLPFSTDNDTTYFIFHQLDVILKAIEILKKYIQERNEEVHKIEPLISSLGYPFNYRQLSIIKHALKNPNERYLIKVHRELHQVTYDTARNDLLDLVQQGCLVKQKISKAFVFTVSKRLLNKIKK